MIIAVACFSCVSLFQEPPSGVYETRTYEWANVSRIESGYSFQTEIRVGQEYSLTVTCDDNFFSILDIRVVNDKLILGSRFSTMYHPSKLKAVITLPELESLHCSGLRRPLF